MKITIKTLKNQQIPMEVEETMTIAQLKAKIAETNATMPVDCQQLIIKGKKLDNNDATLKESNVVEGDFMIIMITKPKPVAKAEDAKQEEPKPVISPAVTIKPQENAESVQPVQPAPV
jgi:UV excision repair protein RAD23